jgi:DNA-binding response OmpR family regulator
MRALLVEDYEPLRKSLGQGIREAGYAIDVASDGEEGLWYARNNPYDVIVLDLMLPRLDGLSLLRELRKSGSHSPVLILTARDGVQDRVEGLDTGADDYLTKPFALEELLARMRALVRRKYNKSQSLLEVEDLQLDTSAKRVYRNGEEVELTAREYELLEYLARRAGQTVSRTEIWDHLYEFDSSATSNVVDVYVGYLRRKLDTGREESLIRTVRGQGYRLGD